MFRAAFVIDAHDREIVAWKALTGAGISGSDVRDMLLKAVEGRFGGLQAPQRIEFLADNNTALETRRFAPQLSLLPCFTPVASPQSDDGVSESLVRTFKRDDVRVTPLPSAANALGQLAGWHSTDKLKRPKNIAIILLPSRSTELNPVENIWQDLRQNWLSNPVFDTYEDIVDAGCEACNKLLAQPQTITSIGARKWALIGQ